MIRNFLILMGLTLASHVSLKSQSIILEGEYTGTVAFNDLAVASPYVYAVANGQGFDKGIEVLNTNNLSNITKVGEFKDLTYADENALSIEVDKNTNVAYLGTNKKFYDISISTPATPSSLFSANANGETQGMHLVGTKLYATRYNYGVAVTNVSNPSSPSSLGTYNPAGNHGCEDIYVSGNYAYVTRKIYNKIWVLNITNLSSIQLTNEYTITGASASVYSVMVKGNYAYIANGTNGLIILDVSNPAAPVEVSRYGATTSGYGYTSVDVVGNYAYVVGSQGLVILDVSDPADPILEDDYPVTGGLWKLKTADNYVYAVGGNTNEKLFVFSYSTLNGIMSANYNSNVLLSPNPVRSEDQVTMKLPSYVSGQLNIKLTDVVHKRVLYENKLIGVNANEFPIDLSTLELKSGMYVISLVTDEATFFERLIVQ